MTETPVRWLRLLPAALALLLLGAAAGAGLALTRLRHDCAQSAEDVTRLRAELADTGRRLQESGAQIAHALRPDVLRDRVAGRLGPMLPGQVIWVRPPSRSRPETLPVPALLPQVAAIEPAAREARPQ